MNTLHVDIRTVKFVGTAFKLHTRCGFTNTCIYMYEPVSIGGQILGSKVHVEKMRPNNYLAWAHWNETRRMEKS